MNFYSIYFTRNGQVVRLPFNPSELPDEQEVENGQYNVLGIGPLSIARDPNQRKVKISSFFPGTVGSSLTSLISFRPPEYYIEFFRSAMRDREPVLYTPTRIDELGVPYALSQVGYYVLVDSFNYREKGGETRDFYYDLECTEYRDPSPNTVQIVQQGTAAASAPAAASASRTRMARAATTAATTADVSAVASPLKAMVEPTRAMPARQLAVGVKCTLNGSYYADQHKGTPATAASGLQVQVVRMDDGSMEAPVYIKGADGTYLGWTAKDMLTVVNRNAV